MARPGGAPENLKPRTTLSKEEARAMQKRSVESRRQRAEARKTMKNTLEILLGKTLKRGELVLPEEIQNMAEVENLNIDVMTAMSIATIQRALLGDIQAIQLIRDTIGEKPSDKVELDQSVTIEAWAKNHKVKL